MTYDEFKAHVIANGDKAYEEESVMEQFGCSWPEAEDAIRKGINEGILLIDTDDEDGVTGDVRIAANPELHDAVDTTTPEYKLQRRAVYEYLKRVREATMQMLRDECLSSRIPYAALRCILHSLEEEGYIAANPDEDRYEILDTPAKEAKPIEDLDTVRHDLSVSVYGITDQLRLAEEAMDGLGAAWEKLLSCNYDDPEDLSGWAYSDQKCLITMYLDSVMDEAKNVRILLWENFRHLANLIRNSKHLCSIIIREAGEAKDIVTNSSLSCEKITEDSKVHMDYLHEVCIDLYDRICRVTEYATA
ncbi:MAG: hypothetical protein LUE27_06105 [Clostridia bacterium]|nr:hypothetical protein [Clostridia bacterium]